jgi:hypothetical protein
MTPDQRELYEDGRGTLTLEAKTYTDPTQGGRVFSIAASDVVLNSYGGPAIIKAVVEKVVERLAEEAYEQVHATAVAKITSRLLKLLELV